LAFIQGDGNGDAAQAAEALADLQQLGEELQASEVIETPPLKTQQQPVEMQAHAETTPAAVWKVTSKSLTRSQ
jgi:hypothetical protein